MSDGTGERPEANGDRRLDLAARAAWLYYVKGRTQEHIAAELGVSRQIVQRLIALANSESLVRFQLLHPLADCIELAERLKDRFGLSYCDVTLNESGAVEDTPAVASVAANYLETLLQQKTPLTVGIGNGKTMREMAMRIRRMDLPQHKCVSLMGNLTRHGRASHYDVVTWLSERLNAECYPLPMPVVTNTVEERAVLQAQPGYRTLEGLVGEAGILMMGIGYWGPEASLYMDGFITEAETAQAMAEGAVAELLGAAIDRKGRILATDYHGRLTSFTTSAPATRPTVIVGSGAKRAVAIHAALTGQLANSLITDEFTAKAVLALD
jgi:DNA-binding transcriptional regulator LsrR (DeoR family)